MIVMPPTGTYSGVWYELQMVYGHISRRISISKKCSFEKYRVAVVHCFVETSVSGVSDMISVVVKGMKMKRKIILGFISVLLLFSVVACGGEDNKDSKDESKESTPTPAVTEDKKVSVDLGEICDKMLAADASLPEMKTVSDKSDNAADLFAYLAEFDYEKVEGYFFSYSATGSAEEVAVVILKDSADAEALKKALEKHVKTRVATFKEYDAAQVSLAQSAKISILKDGQMVSIITTKNSGDVENVLKDLLSKAG